MADEQNRQAIRAGTPRHWRRCGGYNLARFIHDGTIDHYLPQDPRFNLVNLLCGAEGTLAAITELKLKLVPRPKQTALVIIEFPALLAALEATPAILETNPSAVELIDDLSLTMARAKPEYDRLLRAFVQGEPFCFLAVEYYGDSAAELAAKTTISATTWPGARCAPAPITPLLDKARQANVWNLRKVGLGLLMSVRSEWKPIPFIEDTAVPPEHLAAYIPRIEAFCAELGTRMTYYAHASAGCLHIRPLINVKLAPEVEKMKAIGAFVAELLGDYGGALSSEHGDGRVRSWLNRSFYGPALYELFREVKGAFDPDNLFNPGNIVESPPLDAHLRYGPGYQTHAAGHAPAFRAWPGPRGGDVQRRGRLPQADDGRHVPQLHGHPGGGAQHAWPGEHAARCAGRPTAAGRVDQPADVRDHGTLCQLQSLPGGMPLVGGHGEAQDGVSGPLLHGASPARARSAVCAHRPVEPPGQRLACAVDQSGARRLGLPSVCWSAGLASAGNARCLTLPGALLCK